MSSLPRYKSHKVVNAVKIGKIEANIIYPADGRFPSFEVSPEYMAKHKPTAGGYYVVYPGSDNYASWSPAKAFEEGYTLIDDAPKTDMDFGDALEHLKIGNLVARAGWNGKDMFLYWVDGSTFEVNRAPLNRIFPEGTTINYHSHIDMKTVDGTCVPWLASQTDIAAEEFIVTAAQTLTSVVQAAVGLMQPEATSLQTVPAPTQAATGVETIAGTSIQTLQAPTQAAVALMEPAGTAAQSIAAPTQAALGAQTQNVTGTSAQTLPSIVQQAIGVIGGLADMAYLFLHRRRRGR